jgi:hypothetical protein
MPDSQTELEVTSSVTEGQDVKPATESSTAESSTEQGVQKNSMLDAVKAALAGADKSPKSEVTPESTEGTVAKAAGEDAELDEGEIPPEEMKLLTRTVQRRFHVLTAKRKQAEQTVKDLEPRAAVFDRISDVMQRNSLTKEDVDNGFEIMAAIKTSPEKALEMLAPLVRKLLGATGHQLSDELKARVEAGELSEADARELSTARSRASHLTATAEQNEQQRQQEAEERHATTVVNTATKTADAWHAEKAATDPDWHLKQKRVVDGVKLHILDTKQFPQTDKEARTLFEKILKEVEVDLKQFVPKKQAIKPANGNASPGAMPEPTTALEAAKQGLAAMANR